MQIITEMAEGYVHFVCQLIHIYVVGMCTVVKVPQIMNFVKTGTTEGINVKSLFMEFYCFTTLLAYPCANGYPVSGYLEFVLLSIQDLILVVMVLRDRKLATPVNVAALVVYLSFIGGLMLGIGPSWALYAMMAAVTPLSASSKILQMYSIIKQGNSGTVSGLTWALATTTSSSRIFTILVETGDKLLAFISTQASLLSLLLCICVLHYRQPKVKAA